MLIVVNFRRAGHVTVSIRDGNRISLRCKIKLGEEIDPAIFTEVTNYDLEEIAIRLPHDQLFEDELGDKKKL